MTYFLSVLLYAVSLLACAVNGQTQPSSCSLLTDIPSSCAPNPDCTGLVCNSLYGTVTLTIDKCSDPLAVELGLRSSGSTAVSRINYYVGGPEVVTDSSTIGQLTPLRAHFSRNTTHLNFTVSYACYTVSLLFNILFDCYTFSILHQVVTLLSKLKFDFWYQGIQNLMEILMYSCSSYLLPLTLMVYC